MNKLLNTGLLAFALIAALPQAHAHQVWLEQDGESAKLYFGEFGSNLREISPGLLDKFVQPSAVLLSDNGEQPLALTKTDKAFTLSGRAGKGESLVAEEARYPSFEKKEGDKTLRSIWTPAARYIADFSAQKPKLALDVVPTGRAENGTQEVQVFYKGQPLSKAKVGIVTPSGWSQEHHADDQGKLGVMLPWKGMYVVEVHHTDKTPGQRPSAQGIEAFDMASYVTSLSFVHSTGLAPIAALPAAAPNK